MKVTLPDTIDRSWLLRNYQEACDEVYCSMCPFLQKTADGATFCKIESLILLAPGPNKGEDDETEIDPVKRGRWIEEPGMFMCSVCYDPWSAEDEAMIKEFNYCPNCGAQMEGQR